VTHQNLILASASPRRNRILRSLCLPFEVVDSGVSEDLSSAGSPGETATLLALKKAEAVANIMPASVVLAADTVIGFQGRPMGKPADKQNAFEMLSQLRGLSHEVITGLAVIDSDSGRQITAAVSTRVAMREFGDEKIEEYIRSGEPFDKAGAYAIQGMGSRLISSFEGCYNNVVGLPLCETVVLLNAVGIILDRAKGSCRLPSGESCPRTT
jgi:septum formation protein